MRLAWGILNLIASAAALRPSLGSGGDDFAIDRVLILASPLTAPGGLAVVPTWGALVYGLDSATGFLLPQLGVWNIVWAVLLWAGMVCIGYLQWFRLVPALWRRFRKPPPAPPVG